MGINLGGSGQKAYQRQDPFGMGGGREEEAEKGWVGVEGI